MRVRARITKTVEKGNKKFKQVYFPICFEKSAYKFKMAVKGYSKEIGNRLQINSGAKSSNHELPAANNHLGLSSDRDYPYF